MTSDLFLILAAVLSGIAVVLLVLSSLRRRRHGWSGLCGAARRPRRTAPATRQPVAAQEQRIDGFATAGRPRDPHRPAADVLREALTDDARKARTESAELLQRFEAALGQRLGELTQRNEQRIGEMRATLEQQLQKLQADNAQKLEQMRATVDEKLQSTLETRLGQSFKLVSERLEQVQRGLGEMQQLAAGVGDLKRVLTNVKTRGIFGEVQLAALLEQVLTLEQYVSNVATVPGSGERVEFAVRLPGSGDAPILPPIDAKFPREDYERLLDAQERAGCRSRQRRRRRAGTAGADRGRAFATSTGAAAHHRLRAAVPAHRGLYAGAGAQAGAVRCVAARVPITLVADHAAGPAQQPADGFRTLAIEKRSSEVWQLLGAVKNEFGKFATVLEKATTQLDTVQNSIKQAGAHARSRNSSSGCRNATRQRGAQALSGEAADDN